MQHIFPNCTLCVLEIINPVEKAFVLRSDTSRRGLLYSFDTSNSRSWAITVMSTVDRYFTYFQCSTCTDGADHQEERKSNFVWLTETLGFVLYFSVFLVTKRVTGFPHLLPENGMEPSTELRGGETRAWFKGRSHTQLSRAFNGSFRNYRLTVSQKRQLESLKSLSLFVFSILWPVPRKQGKDDRYSNRQVAGTVLPIPTAARFESLLSGAFIFLEKKIDVAATKIVQIAGRTKSHKKYQGMGFSGRTLTCKYRGVMRHLRNIYLENLDLSFTATVLSIAERDVIYCLRAKKSEYTCDRDPAHRDFSRLHP